ncbi:MAG: molybdate ABC transporter substrate-binding protein [Polyangiales bacterium]
MRIGRRAALVTGVAMFGCHKPASWLCFAAASTAEALREACKPYEARFSFGGSGDLARQIESGARPDVFLSADEAKLDGLVAKGLVRPEDRKPLLSNRLVVVVAEGVAKVGSAKELAQMKRIAIGDPKLVPAGEYARKWLESEGLWSELASKMIPSADVRAALVAVDTGAVDAAIVYRTDLAAAHHAKLAFEPEKQPRIVYPIASLSDSGKRLVAHLSSPPARAVFARHGFSAPDG